MSIYGYNTIQEVKALIIGLNIVEDIMLASLDNKHRATVRALNKMKKRPHTLVEYRKSVSEFSLQCNIHRTCQAIFAGLPVFYRALENSIPLGGEAAERAQGKLTAKGCNKNDPDYLIMWLDAEYRLQAVFIEFKKVGESVGAAQRARHVFIEDCISRKTEIVHDPEEFWAVLVKYGIPNRGRGLF